MPDLLISVYCVLCLAHFILFLLELQIVYTVLIVHAALQWVNREIAGLCTSADTNHISTFLSPWKLREKFCDYRHSYMSILKLARQKNRNEGPMLLLIFFHTCLLLVISGRHFIYYMNIPVDTPFRTLMVYGQIVLFVSHIFKLFIIIDPCHRTQQEVEETKKILGHLMTNSTCHSFVIELKMFCRQLLHQSPLYSPLNICPLERPLLTT
ncbi:unnamed protein product [Parnassius apollo]|nr:unnamed protein product [Parnassius apollo]